MIELRTLGSLELRGTEGETFDPVLVQPKRVALLAYLVLARPRGFQRRDVLLALFWPDCGATHARDALNQSLRFLRRFLGKDVLISRGDDELGVDMTRLWCDAAAFEQRIAAGDDVDALSLYRGNLLEGVFISEAPVFERWLDTERASLHEQVCNAAGRLTARCEAMGDLTGGLQWARRAIGLSPYDEVAFRRLLDLLDRSGDRARAVREYALFATRLREELEVEPSPETQAAVEGIRARATSNELLPSAPAASAVTTVPTKHVSEAEVDWSPRRHRLVPRLARFAAAAALLLLAGGGVSIIPHESSDLEPRRVLVIPFENRTGDPALDPVGTIAADWVVQGLARTDVVDVVPSFQAVQLVQALSGEGRSGDAGTRTRTLAQALGAGTAVAGTYYLRDGGLEFQAQVIDVRRGRLLQAVHGVRGPQSDPMIAIDALRSRTVGAVDFQFDVRLRAVVRSAHRPPSYEAYQAFAAGMDQRQGMEWRQSLAYFRKAFALDTTFTLALFLAAIEDLNLREFAQADTLIRMFGRSRERLSTLERLFLEWIEAKIRGDLPGVLEAARKLVPYGYGSQMAIDALDANRPQEVREALEGLNTDLLPDMWELATGRRRTEAYHRLGSYRRELSEAKRSRKRHPNRVEPALWEIRALAALGRARPARERLEEALAMPAESNWPPGETMLWAVDELREHGHTSDAAEVLLRALAWYRSLPDSQARLMRHRRYRAAALLKADSLEAAEAAFRELAADSPEDIYYIASVGVALARRGDRRAATEIAETALNSNPPYDFGHHLYERARIEAQLGNADDAIELLRRAFANGFRFAFVGSIGGTARSPDGRPHLDPAFDGLRAHPGFQELARGRD